MILFALTRLPSRQCRFAGESIQCLSILRWVLGKTRKCKFCQYWIGGQVSYVNFVAKVLRSALLIHSQWTGSAMRIPSAFETEYRNFLRGSGFEEADPRALLSELASRDLSIYVREVYWLSDFIGRLEQETGRAA